MKNILKGSIRKTTVFLLIFCLTFTLGQPVLAEETEGTIALSELEQEAIEASSEETGEGGESITEETGDTDPSNEETIIREDQTEQENEEDGSDDEGTVPEDENTDVSSEEVPVSEEVTEPEEPSIEAEPDENPADSTEESENSSEESSEDKTEEEKPNKTSSDKKKTVETDEEEKTQKKANGVSKDTVVEGTFAAAAGMDVTTIRYYTDAEKSDYAFAEFTINDKGEYAYSFKAPYDGFEAVQGTETPNGGEDVSKATIVAAYYNLSVWDGAVDVSWYDASASEYHLYQPAQLAGLAAIVNGVIDSQITDVNVKGFRSDLNRTDTDRNINRGLPDCIQNELQPEANPDKGPEWHGLPAYDFTDKTVYLEADMYMGGMDGQTAWSENIYEAKANLHDGTHEGYAYYPNWVPIGGYFCRDVNDLDTACESNFMGVFDGNGHYIYDLYCYRWTYPKEGRTAYWYADSTGFIGNIGYMMSEDQPQPTIEPAVRNLGLDGFIIGRRSVGGIIGRVSCHTHSKYKGSMAFENLVNKATVLSTDSKGVAGIIGTFWHEAIVDGDVTYPRGGKIINCYNRGNIRQCEYAGPAGGIIGENDSADIFCCYSTGIVLSSAKMGRGIGANDNGRNYTVSDCYYLKGNYDCDVTAYQGYYYYEADKSVKVSVQEMTSDQMSNGTLLSALNINGTAYTAGSDGYPVLVWEAGGGSGTLTLTQPDGGTVFSLLPEGTYAAGTIACLSQQIDEGFAFRYFTLNNKEMSGDYVTINGTTEVSAHFQSAGAGVLEMPNDPVCNVKVYKVTGSEGNYTYTELKNGDAVYENDFLTIEANVRNGVIPENLDYEYKAAAGLENPYIYTISYSGAAEDPTDIKSFSVSDKINAENAILRIDVEAVKVEKQWKYQADTSWYDPEDPKTEYTITTAEELAGIDSLLESGSDENKITFEGVTFKLGNDISLQNKDSDGGNRYWDGIGNTESPFMGNFDGNGYKITELYGSSNGLFAKVKGTSAANRAEIKNVTVQGKMKGVNASGIAGITQYVNISNCSNYCVIDSSAFSGTCYNGGIVGQDFQCTTVKNCVNYAPVSGASFTGGIVGYSSGTTSNAGEIMDCVNFGNITNVPYSTNVTTYAGGIVSQTNGKVTRCANYGTIESQASAAGGLIGSMRNTGTTITAYLTDSYNAGNVRFTGNTENRSVGGLIGAATRFVVRNSFNVGTVSAPENILCKQGSFAGTYTTNTKNSTQSVYCLDESCAYMLDNMTAAEVAALDKTDVTGLIEEGAAAFADKSKVLAEVNGNRSFVLTNGSYPELASVAKAHTHKGGTATCSEQAACEECGLHYGELDPENHTHTEQRNVVIAEWMQDGYTGDTYCSDCGKYLHAGETIPVDTSIEVFRVKIVSGEEVLDEKTYSVAEFDALKSTETVGYQYGTLDGNISNSICVASNRYVTFESLLNDMGYDYSDLNKAMIYSTGSFGEYTGDELRNDNWYINEDGEAIHVPASIGIYYDRLKGAAEHVVKTSKLGNLILLLGVTNADIEAKYVGGFRLITPVVSVTFDVVPDTLTGIKVTQDPEHAAYHVGETFQKDSIIVTGTFESGKDRPIRSFTIDKTETLTAADTEVTVSYKGFEQTLPITVSDHVYDPDTYLCTEKRSDGNECGEKDPEAPFAITSVTLKSSSLPYTGKARTQTATMVVKAKVHGEEKVLTKGTDFTVTYSNNTNVGTAKVTVKGTGNYTGSITRSFKITAVALSSATLKNTSLVYTGKARTQTVTVKAKVNGSLKTLTKGTDYTVTYKNNKAVGKATVTIKGKGNYKGTLTKTFKIIPKATKITKLTAGSKQFTAKWTKVTAQTTGYQVQYSTVKSFKTVIASPKVTKNTTIIKTVSKLKSAKTYYVRVRTYKKVGSVYYYSAWSPVKSVKTK